jgi:hypothetical protein
MIVDRSEPRRAFGVVAPHVVPRAIVMRNERRRHASHSFDPIIAAFK